MVQKFWDLSQYNFGEFEKNPAIPYGSVTNVTDLMVPYGAVTIEDPEFPTPYGSVTVMY